MSNQPEFQFVDKPNKPQKRSSYIRKVVKLDNKEEQFSMKQFQSVRKVSNAREMIDSLRRIGMCLNKVDISQLPKSNIDKVCFLYISNYENTHEPLGVGPFNDAYLFAFIHYKLGYKIVFLYNSDKETFVNSLTYFLTFTTSTLTIYFSGRDSFSKVRKSSHGIQFNYEEYLSNIEFGRLVGGKSNGKSKILIFSDCSAGGAIFSMKAAKKTENEHPSQVVCFSVDKNSLDMKGKRRSHGIFTYYFCRLIRQFPDSSLEKMLELLNLSMKRFDQKFSSLVTNDSLIYEPMIEEAASIFKVN